MRLPLLQPLLQGSRRLGGVLLWAFPLADLAPLHPLCCCPCLNGLRPVCPCSLELTHNWVGVKELRWPGSQTGLGASHMLGACAWSLPTMQS